LKHGGRGHDPAGIAATAEGSLVIECPACPHPGRNLPANWEDAPPVLQYVIKILFTFPDTDKYPSRFLYTLFLAVDANFKLKSKDRGIKDFQLDPGWGCYVENSRYEKHIANYVDEPEVCRNLARFPVY